MAPLMFNSNIQAFNLAVSSLLKNPSLLVPNLTISTFLDLPEHLGPHLISSTSPTNANTEEKEIPQTSKTPNIRALILDKDNTLCLPKTTVFPPAYLQKLTDLRTSPTSPFNRYSNPHGILIVSNTAGSRPDVPAYEAEASDLERQLAHLGIQVFRARRDRDMGRDGIGADPSPSSSLSRNRWGSKDGYRRKPFCGKDVLAWLYERKVINRPDEVAVVGDRLGTDVLMASAEMGSWSVWCKDGVVMADPNAPDHNGHHSQTNREKQGQGKRNRKEDYRGFMAKMETVLESYLRETRGVKPAVPDSWRNQS